jgi:tape measure domain-containing protein
MALPGLIVEIEGRVDKLEKALKRANKAQSGSANAMERRAKQSADRINATYGAMGNQIGATFKKMIGPALALGGVAGLAQLTKSTHKLAEEYRQVENTLKAIGQTSDEAAEKLAAAAIRSGSGVADMGSTIMRVQKASNGGYDETIRRVETLNKLLTVGGASTAEQNSVATQLSQALSSGVLAGDELKSLREAAPVELLDAIAKAAGGTRGQLKDMGAEGKLTSDVVLAALDSMAASADQNFSKMTMTSERAMTNLATGMTTFVGRLDEGLGASERIAIGMNDLGVFLNNNAAAAEQFGLSIVAAYQTAQQIADEAEAALEAMGDTIRQSAIGSVIDLGGAFGDTGLTIGETLDAIIQGLATFNGAMEGSAMAVAEAFKMIPDAISGAMEAALNGVIIGVEAMINRVLDGVKVVAQAVDTLTAKIPGTDGTNLAAGIGNVTLGRVSGLKTENSTRSVSEAYAAGAASGEKAVTDAAASVGEFFGGIQDRFDENRIRLEGEAAARDGASVAARENAASDNGGAGNAPAAGGGSGVGKKGGAKGAAETLSDYQKAAQGIREKTQALQQEASALAGVTGAQARQGNAIELARAKADLLAAAQRSNLQITPELTAKIDELAQSYVDAGFAADEAANKIEEIQANSKAGAAAITDVFVSMATGAMTAKEAMGQLILEMIKATLQKRLLAAAEGAGGGIIGTVGKFLAGGFAEGGYTGAGGKHEPAGVVHRGEYVMSKEATARLGVPQLNALHESAKRGYAGGGLVGGSASGKGVSLSMAKVSAAPAITISAPITINSNGGTPAQNQDLAKQMSKELDATVRRTIQSEIMRQKRPGNLLAGS